MEASRRQDGKKIGSLSRAIHECQGEIDKLYADLENISQEYDTLAAEYDRQLDDLNNE